VFNVQASNSPRYKWWQAPVLSFYNKSFYIDVLNNWQGNGIGYLFIMCVLAAVIGAAPMALLCYKGYTDKAVPIFFAQVPKIDFEDGHVTVDKHCPYQIKEPATGTVIAEFRTDQSGPPKISSAGTDPPIIVTHDVLYIDSPSTTGAANDTRILSFADAQKLWGGSAKFDGNDLYRWWKSLMYWIPIAVLILGIPMLFAGHLFQALVYGLVAQYMFNSNKITVTYSNAVRMATMAITPCIIINSLVVLSAIAAPVLVPLQNGVTLLSIPIALSILYVASNALKMEAQAAEVVPPVSPPEA
jgi:Protein of unknown function (DUF1189)